MLQDFVGRLFSGRRTRYDEGLESATPRFRAAAHARAADAARDEGDRERALELYGEAINLYLEAGHGRAAELICQRMILMYPPVVRARFTLAAIAIGRGEMEGTEARLRTYAAAAREADVVDLAVPALVRLAVATDQPVLRGYVAMALRAVGRDELASRVELGEAAPPAGGTRWSLAVAAASERPVAIAAEDAESD